MVGPRKPANDMQERRSSEMQASGAAVPSFFPRRVAWFE